MAPGSANPIWFGGRANDLPAGGAGQAEPALGLLPPDVSAS